MNSSGIGECICQDCLAHYPLGHIHKCDPLMKMLKSNTQPSDKIIKEIRARAKQAESDYVKSEKRRSDMAKLYRPSDKKPEGQPELVCPICHKNGCKHDMSKTKQPQDWEKAWNDFFDNAFTELDADQLKSIIKKQISLARKQGAEEAITLVEEWFDSDTDGRSMSHLFSDLKNKFGLKA